GNADGWGGGSQVPGAIVHWSTRARAKKIDEKLLFAHDAVFSAVRPEPPELRIGSEPGQKIIRHCCDCAISTKAFVKGLRPVAHCGLMSVAGRATPAGVVIPSRVYRYRNSGAQPVIGDVSDEENTESAPPSSDMNSRRFMSDMGACSPRFVPTKAMAVLLVCRPSRVSRSGWQVLGQHLKCSESRGVGKEFRFHLPRA